MILQTPMMKVIEVPSFHPEEETRNFQAGREFPASPARTRSVIYTSVLWKESKRLLFYLEIIGEKSFIKE